MRSSSTRLRIGGALAATSLTLVFGLGSTALADQGQGEIRRNDRANVGSDQARPTGPAEEAAPTEDTDSNDGGTPNNVSDSGDNQHPSGNDRSVESGSSGNQGNATAEPDQDGRGPERDNGGLDQPNGPGGADRADQDGNNGCGNDDDFEDDNEGLCRKPRATTPPPVVPVETIKGGNNQVVIVDAGSITPDAVVGTRVAAAVEAQVLGVVVERPAVLVETVQPPAAAAPTAVLGATVTRSAPLARTGLGIGTLMLLAGGLLVAGLGMVRRPRGSHFHA